MKSKIVPSLVHYVPRRLSNMMAVSVSCKVLFEPFSLILACANVEFAFFIELFIWSNNSQSKVNKTNALNQATTAAEEREKDKVNDQAKRNTTSGTGLRSSVTFGNKKWQRHDKASW